MTPRTDRPAAVLWDFDGTLVDTEPYWMAAELELVEEHGGTWSKQQGLQLVGNDLLVSGRMIIEQTGIPLTPAQVVDRLLDGVVAHIREQIPWRPGARELLADLQAHEVPCGLVTMSYPRFIEPVLTALPDGAFAAIVTGDQVAAGKPDPEAYLRAAELLGAAPSDCVAIEDSLPGATSAATAGCRVVVVPAHVPVPPHPGWAVLTDLPRTADELIAIGG